jgi:hypothetical protein
MQTPRQRDRSGKWWRMTTAEREALIRQIWDTVPHMSKMAKEMGCAPTIFSALAKRLGLRPRRRGYARDNSPGAA